MDFWEAVSGLILILVAIFASVVDMYISGEIIKIWKRSAKIKEEKEEWKRQDTENVRERQKRRQSAQEELERAKQALSKAEADKADLRRTAGTKGSASGGAGP